MTCIFGIRPYSIIDIKGLKAEQRQRKCVVEGSLDDKDKEE